MLARIDKQVLSKQEQDVIELYLNNIDVKESSRIAYRKGLNNFKAYLGNKDYNNANILDYKKYLGETYSVNTANLYLNAVKGFYNWLEFNKLGFNNAKYIKRFNKSNNFKKTALTIEQVIELLNSLDRDTLAGKRDYALIYLMINTGLRVSEVQQANISDIETNTGKALLYIRGKGKEDKDNYVVLESKVLEALEDYLTARGNYKGALFQGLSNRSNERLAKGSISRIVKTSFRNIGLDTPRLTAHSTRHTAITFSLLGGASLQQAQAMARHSNINTTLIYAHNLDRLNNNAESSTNKYLEAYLWKQHHK